MRPRPRWWRASTSTPAGVVRHLGWLSLSLLVPPPNPSRGRLQLDGDLGHDIGHHFGTSRRVVAGKTSAIGGGAVWGRARSPPDAAACAANSSMTASTTLL